MMGLNRVTLKLRIDFGGDGVPGATCQLSRNGTDKKDIQLS